MNDYASMLQDHWRANMPEQYAAIHDRDQFFTQSRRTSGARIT